MKELVKKILLDSAPKKEEIEAELKKCAVLGGDIEKYSQEGFDYRQLIEIRKGLEDAIDIAVYLDKNLPWYEMQEIRLALMEKIDILPYIQGGFDFTQLEEIRFGLGEKLDVSVYARTEYFAWQMREIRAGLKKRLKVSLYADPEYDWLQMREIRLGLENKIDVRTYAAKENNCNIMREIRLGLEEGIDIAPYILKGYPTDVIHEIRKGHQNGIDMVPYVKEGYDGEQLKQIRLSLEHNVQLLIYADIHTGGSQMEQLRLGLEHGIEVFDYADSQYNRKQMKEIRLGLEHGVDVSKYTNYYFHSGQMREIRLGLEEGIDVGHYARLMYSAADMWYMRKMVSQIAEIQAAAEAGCVMSAHAVSGAIESLAAAEKETQEQNCQITTSEDGMQAYVILSGAAGAVYEVEDIVEALKAAGVIQGIDREKIAAAIQEKKYYEPIEAAVGKRSVDGENGYYEYLFRTNLPRIPKLLPDGSVDYKNVDFFEEVKEGQEIALYHPSTPGEYGYTVRGTLIVPRRGKDLPFLRGKGFIRLEDDTTYVTTESGRIELKDGQVIVSPMYTFEGDVTRSVGNIRFPGHIHIMGSVGSGVTICGTGDVVIEGNVEGADIQAGGKVMVKSGVNADGKGSIQAGETIEGRFFERANLFAEKGIKCNYIMNSHVKTMGTVTVTGTKGAIVGGVTEAMQGVSCYTIGSNAHVKTIISVGMNELYWEKFRQLDQEIYKLAIEMQTFQNGIQKYEKKYSRQQLANIAVYQKLGQAVVEEGENIKKLKEKQERMHRLARNYVTVRARGMVHVDGIIKIDKQPIIVNTRAKNVLFKKSGEKVVAVSG